MRKPVWRVWKFFEMVRRPPANWMAKDLCVLEFASATGYCGS